MLTLLYVTNPMQIVCHSFDACVTNASVQSFMTNMTL